MREEDNPLVTNELMEVNGTVGGVGLEVWGNGSETETGNKYVSVRVSAKQIL